MVYKLLVSYVYTGATVGHKRKSCEMCIRDSNSSMQRSPACLYLACASLSVLSEKKQKIFSEGVPSFCVSMSVVG